MNSEAGIAVIRQPPAARWLSRLARPTLVIYWMALAIGTHWPRLKLVGEPQSLFDQAFSYDKIAHVSAFALLMLLLHLAKPLGRQVNWRTNALAAMVIAAGYALLDEYTQQWFDRTVSMADIVANLIGVLGMYLVITSGPGPRPKRLWMAVVVRMMWLTAGPVLFWLAITPRGARIAIDMYQTLGLAGYTRNPDKVAHFVLAMLLTWLLALAAPAGRSLPRLSMLLTILMMGTAGPVIELLQHRTGRGFNMADLSAHQHGLLTALGIWVLLRVGRTLVLLCVQPARRTPRAWEPRADA